MCDYDRVPKKKQKPISLHKSCCNDPTKPCNDIVIKKNYVHPSKICDYEHKTLPTKCENNNIGNGKKMITEGVILNFNNLPLAAKKNYVVDRQEQNEKNWFCSSKIGNNIGRSSTDKKMFPLFCDYPSKIYDNYCTTL